MKQCVTALSAVVTILALVSESGAGRVQGPRAVVKDIPAQGSALWVETFQQGELAMADLADDGNLEVFVYDNQGTLVANALGKPATWIPAHTGPFRVEVRNHGCCPQVVLLRLN